MSALPKAGDSAAVFVELSKLLPWARNPRRNEATIPQVIASIEELARDVLAKHGEEVPAKLAPEQLVLGWGAPIVARLDNGEVIAGHSRLKAALRLKLPVVPVRYVDASEAGAHKQALRDNKAAELSEWDVGILSEMAADTSLVDLGWGEHEVADLGRAKRPDGRESGIHLDGRAASPNRKLTIELFIACQDTEAVEAALNLAMQRGAANRGSALVMLAHAFTAGADVR